jgi:hypothetical protein
MLVLGGVNMPRIFAAPVLIAVPLLVWRRHRRVLPHAPADLVHGSVGRSVQRRLPADQGADGDRSRRVVRRGPGWLGAEAVLPAGSAHGFHLRGDRRGAWIRRASCSGDRRCTRCWSDARSGSACARWSWAATSPATAPSASRCGSALQSFVSIGVNLGVLPTKGLTLPLISSGGSSVLMTCAAMGLLLRVSYELDRTERQVAAPAPRAGPECRDARSRDARRAHAAAGTTWRRCRIAPVSVHRLHAAGSKPTFGAMQ